MLLSPPGQQGAPDDRSQSCISLEDLTLDLVPKTQALQERQCSSQQKLTEGEHCALVDRRRLPAALSMQGPLQNGLKHITLHHDTTLILQHAQFLACLAVADSQQVSGLLIVQLQEGALDCVLAVDGVQVAKDLVDGSWDDTCSLGGGHSGAAV